MKESIVDIKNKLNSLNIEELELGLNDYLSDERPGVQKLVKSSQNKLNAYRVELKRMVKMRTFEREFDHCLTIAGVDEVGRGPFAGPVVTAAVILPKEYIGLYINDSKQLSEEKREVLYDEIMEQALAVGIGMVHNDEIDEINILNATRKAMAIAVGELKIQPEQVLVDAVTIPGLSIPQKAIIKGDEKSISIAAASIIAKVTRDRMMSGYDELFPGYSFGKNKGYGTKDHIDAIYRLGVCPIHRRSFLKNLNL